MIDTTIGYFCDRILCFTFDITSIIVGIGIGGFIFSIAYLLGERRRKKKGEKGK